MKLHLIFLFLSVLLVSACGGGGSSNTPPPPSFDHSTVAGQSCTTSTCHDGVSPHTYKSAMHPLTTELCESCHGTSSWRPVTLPFDHSQVVTTVCMDCHDGKIATGKGPTHINTSLDCDVCHTTTGWLP